jgi:hypothetical protein
MIALFSSTRFKEQLILLSSIISVSVLCCVACKKDVPVEEEETKTVIHSIPEKLPLSAISLQDLSAFQPNTDWQVAGDAYANWEIAQQLKIADGTGILLTNKANATPLTFNLAHGDLEMTLEFLLPINGNAQLLLQGIYPILLTDSWNNTNTAQFCGALPQITPSVNACKAPGLWQTLNLLFRAPTFDAAGKKIKEAQFDYVILNGMTIHKNVTLKSDEAGTAIANLLLKSTTPVAFRNIQTKRFFKDQVTLENITYKKYIGTWDYIPNFQLLTPVAEDKVTLITGLEQLAGQTDHFGFVFEGELNIPKEGTYLFETQIDDGGDLYIDDQLIIHNQGEPGLGTERALVNLTAGKHSFKLTYYEEVWFAWISIWVEGPEIEKQPLASLALGENNREKEPKLLEIRPKDAPEMVRAFIQYGDEKRTHTIAVGDPLGVHYAYDLNEGAIINAWKGRFADVTEMWVGRGESQLLKPLNAKIEPSAGISTAQLASEKAGWIAYVPDGFKPLGYSMNAKEQPVFEYQLDGLMWRDNIEPFENKLRRTLEYSSQEAKGYWHKLASASSIMLLENGWYNIGGAYYIDYKGKDKPIIRTTKGGQEMIVPIALNQPMVYELIW